MTISIKHQADAKAWADSDEREPVFTVEAPNPEYQRFIDEGRVLVEGEHVPDPTIEVTYTMPKRPNLGLSLAYLKLARQNADLAMSWIIETAIGSEGYDALADELSQLETPEAQRDLLQSITERIQRVALGGLEAPKA